MTERRETADVEETRSDPDIYPTAGSDNDSLDLKIATSPAAPRDDRKRRLLAMTEWEVSASFQIVPFGDDRP
jgi:hypothetical protein